MDTKRTYMMKLQNELITSGQFPACTSCENFDNKEEVCKYNGMNIRPPANIIVTGCEIYSMDIRF